MPRPIQKSIRSAAAAFIVSSLVLPACAEPPRLGSAEAPAKAPGAIRLATYNLLNLFDGIDDPTLNGDQDDMKVVKPDAEKQALAAQIRALDADILAVEEIESLQALTEFRDEHLQGLGYDHVVSIDAGDSRGIEQGLLSRFPITEAAVFPWLPLGGVHPPMFGDRPNRYAGEPLMGRRSPLRAVVEVPATKDGGPQGVDAPYRMTLFVVHHKSGWGNEYWREAETRAFLSMIGALEQADPARNIAVLGDFNAKPHDESVQAYLRAGMVDVFTSRPANDPRLLTHESDRTIDFILVNPSMAKELRPDSAFVLGSPLRPEGADWRTTPTPDGYASDHLPVAVDLVPVDR